MKLHCVNCGETEHQSERHHSGEDLPRCTVCGTFRPNAPRPRRLTRGQVFGIARDSRNRRKKNPVPASSVERQIQQGATLYQRFSGHEAEIVGKVAKPNVPDVLVGIGKIDGIMYSTIRDGKLEKFIHEFNSSARPLFAVAHDGKQLFMLGGAYDFTERGIVDRTRRSRSRK